MEDTVLKSIHEEYELADSWEMDSDGSIRVQMPSMELLGGIAGDIEVHGKTYFLKRIFAAFGGQLTAKFEEA